MTWDKPVIALSISQTLVWAGTFYVFPATLLYWEAGFDWSRTQLTLAITLAVFSSALAAPVSGRIIDRGHGPVLLGAAVVLGGLAVMGLTLVTTPIQFYSVWIVIGLAHSGSLYDACFALVTRARGAQARKAIVWITLVAGFAGTISFPVVHLLSEALGWRVALLIIGGATALLVAPLQFAGARAMDKARAIVSAPQKPSLKADLLGRPVFWFLAFGLATLALVHGTTLHHLLPLLDERQVAPGFAVFLASLIGPMQVVGRLIMVALQNRIQSQQFLFVAYGVMGGATLLLLVAGNIHALLALSIMLYGCAWGTVSILRPVIARELLGQENFGTKSGYLTLVFLTFAASSAYLGALIWSVVGYAGLLSILSLVLAGGAVLYRGAQRRGADTTSG